ncbi:MLP-like protein 423 [Linum perenne]
MTTETMEVHLNSSANDVWGAVTAATTIFPRALRGLYQGIRTVSGDGFTAGSIRTITFGHLLDRVVKTAMETIRDIDHQNMTIESRFRNDGGEFGLVPTFFDTCDIKTTVVPFRDQWKAPRCTINWEVTYTGWNGNANIGILKKFTMQSFLDLDVYLKYQGGIR